MIRFFAVLLFAITSSLTLAWAQAQPDATDVKGDPGFLRAALKSGICPSPLKKYKQDPLNRTCDADRCRGASDSRACNEDYAVCLKSWRENENLITEYNAFVDKCPSGVQQSARPSSSQSPASSSNASEFSRRLQQRREESAKNDSTAKKYRQDVLTGESNDIAHHRDWQRDEDDLAAQRRELARQQEIERLRKAQIQRQIEQDQIDDTAAIINEAMTGIGNGSRSSSAAPNGPNRATNPRNDGPR